MNSHKKIVAQASAFGMKAEAGIAGLAWRHARHGRLRQAGVSCHAQQQTVSISLKISRDTAACFVPRNEATKKQKQEKDIYYTKF